MDGEQFDAELPHAPTRIIGQEIHRDLCGVYELIEQVEDLVTYRLREDDDFYRVKRSHDRQRVMRNVLDLVGRFRV